MQACLCSRGTWLRNRLTAKTPSPTAALGDGAAGRPSRRHQTPRERLQPTGMLKLAFQRTYANDPPRAKTTNLPNLGQNATARPQGISGHFSGLQGPSASRRRPPHAIREKILTGARARRAAPRPLNRWRRIDDPLPGNRRQHRLVRCSIAERPDAARSVPGIASIRPFARRMSFTFHAKTSLADLRETVSAKTEYFRVTLSRSWECVVKVQPGSLRELFSSAAVGIFAVEPARSSFCTSFAIAGGCRSRVRTPSLRVSHVMAREAARIRRSAARRVSELEASGHGCQLAKRAASSV